MSFSNRIATRCPAVFGTRARWRIQFMARSVGSAMTSVDISMTYLDTPLR